MPKFMLPETALARLVEDEGASIADRVSLEIDSSSSLVHVEATTSSIEH